MKNFDDFETFCLNHLRLDLPKDNSLTLEITYTDFYETCNKVMETLTAEVGGTLTYDKLVRYLKDKNQNLHTPIPQSDDNLIKQHIKELSYSFQGDGNIGSHNIDDFNKDDYYQCVKTLFTITITDEVFNQIVDISNQTIEIEEEPEN